MTTTFKENGLKTISDVKKLAYEKIKEESQGKQMGLKLPYHKLNIAFGKYLRFGSVTLIAGASGHGKSYLINQFNKGFVSESLNGKCELDYVIANNSFEMLPEDDIIRTVSSDLGRSYFNLLSSEYNPITGNYNTLSDDDLSVIHYTLFNEDIIEPDLVYFDTPCTVNQIIKNVKLAKEYYQDKHKKLTVPRAVVPIDHSLLVEKDDSESTIMDTLSALAKAAIGLKKQGDAVIILGQLNNNIESTERIRNKDTHYPLKSDIYAQAQLYNACDNVLTIHRPELMNIQYYGQYQIPTNDLVHLQLLKCRFGRVGSIWLKNELYRGKFTENREVEKWISDKIQGNNK